MEISAYSRDFLYLNILANSVKLAQDLSLCFNIRDYVRKPPQVHPNPDGHHGSSLRGSE